jgi:hypothetical protein
MLVFVCISKKGEAAPRVFKPSLLSSPTTRGYLFAMVALDRTAARSWNDPTKELLVPRFAHELDLVNNMRMATVRVSEHRGPREFSRVEHNLT